MFGWTVMRVEEIGRLRRLERAALDVHHMLHHVLAVRNDTELYRSVVPTLHKLCDVVEEKDGGDE